MSNRALNLSIRRSVRRRLWHVSILAGIGLFFMLITLLIQPFYTFNLWSSDQLLGAGSPSPNIVVAGIDDASLEAYGKLSAWPRRLHAEAINNLKQAGATVIGYDIIFADASPDDADLAAAIKAAGNVVLAVAGTNRLPVKDSELTLSDFLLPAELLLTNSQGLGHINIVPDADGKVRRAPLIATDESGETYPSLGIAMLDALFSLPAPENYAIAGNKINLAMREIPVDRSYSMRLSYAVTDGGLAQVSYRDIIANDFDPAMVKNKIVLVGVTATGDVDTWPVPAASVRVPGVLLHAAVIDTVLRTSFVAEAGLNVTLLLILLVTGICALLFPWAATWRSQSILKTTGISAGLLIIYVVICAFVSNRGLILNVFYPSLTLAALYVGNVAFLVVREQADKNLVKDLFGRYVSPQVSTEILALADEGELRLGGEEREVTVLFADIRNFTAISEKLSPDAVVKLLNACLPVIIDAIVHHGGLVNKFAGDSIMGVWNAPKPREGHARLAVQAALDARSAMSEQCDHSPELADVQFGIGINTGTALAGNVGSPGRVEYTVIGDAVNLASRICGAAPGKDILIGPETYRRVGDDLEVEPLPPQVFKGKSQPLVVYRVKGWRAE